jgi:hypothetical protein
LKPTLVERGQLNRCATPQPRMAGANIGAHIRIVLAIASFVIYATAVLMLGQHRNIPFLPEREAFAAAVSTTHFGAPLGTMYSGLRARIRDPNTPLEPALKQATDGKIEPGIVLPYGGMDGNGVGYIVLVTGAMLIFGATTACPILAMLALMGVSGTAFLWRFGSENALVIMLYFLGLTLLLFTPVVWEPRVAPEIPIGGIRYFSVVGMLPAFYLAAEFVDVAALRKGIRWLRFSLLALQAIILMLAILTRTSNLGLLAGLGLIWLYSMLRGRRDGYGIRLQLGKGAAVALAAGGFVALILALLPPRYLGEGRVTGVAWHRALMSLGINPKWPFGNLREIYDCDYPDLWALATGIWTPGQRLQPGLLDANGVCVWIHYAHTHNIRAHPVELASMESAEREAFFSVVKLYPRQVWDTYFHYKSSMLAAEIEQALYPKFDLSKYTPMLRGLFWAAFAVLLAFLLTPSIAPEPNGSLRFIGITVLFALSAFPGYYIAWPGTAQTFELKLYVLLVFGAVLNALAAWVTRSIKPYRNRGALLVGITGPRFTIRN